MRTIWTGADGVSAEVLDQTKLPWSVEIRRLASAAEMADAISTMVVRGAPLLGAAGAYGMWLALLEDPSDAALAAAASMLRETRPTAVNLGWAIDTVVSHVAGLPQADRADAALAATIALVEADIAACRAEGEHGAGLIAAIAAAKPGETVNVLTHCNAGWLATIDRGTALAPVFEAFERGIDIHVWVDETRPRNQGASLTAWELAEEGVPHTVIADNTGGHLMQHGLVDLCFVGADRVTANGDVCNKIGTYLKALAASDNGVPFYAVLPSSTIDWGLDDGVAQIPIEQRAAGEMTHLTGLTEAGEIETIRVVEARSPVANYAFDVTPARLVTGIVTERGIAPATREGLALLFPERAGKPHDA